MKILDGWLVGLVAVLSLSVACGEDEPELSQGGPGRYLMSTGLANPLHVQVGGVIGRLSLNLADAPLPQANAEVDLGSLIADGTIRVTVEHSASGVSFDLSQGTLVYRTPWAPGEYAVEACCIMTDGYWVEARITWFNEFQGASLREGEEYGLVIVVLNNPWFGPETIARTVVVDSEVQAKSP